MFFQDLNYYQIAGMGTKTKRKNIPNVLKSTIQMFPEASNQELSKAIGKSLAQTKRYIKKLVDGGILTSHLSYNVYFQGGVKKIITNRKLCLKDSDAISKG